nr:unnamed protein product [Callosobruchus analis]
MVQQGKIRQKNLFEHMALKITRINKSNVTPGNCENRWKVLERAYKKYIDYSNKTGRGR